MNITTGYELSTSLTNLLIFIVSIYSYIKTKDKYWKLFFLFLSIDSFLGVIVHGFVMNNIIHNTLWIILTLFFVLSINTLLKIFINLDNKYIIILSIIISIILLLQFYLKMNFLFTFTIYSLIIIIFSFFFMIKNNYYNIFFILGYLSQIIGGVFLLSRVRFVLLDYNGIYHIFMALNILLFYMGTKKQLSK